jgi:hypothetical protein
MLKTMKTAENIPLYWNKHHKIVWPFIAKDSIRPEDNSTMAG